MKSILLVDDEATASYALQQTLNRFGYQVEVVNTMEAALRAAQDKPYDLVLTDLNLRSEDTEYPDVANGTGLIRQLRASQFCNPILTFTVLDGSLYETASLDAGADDFILKTIDIPRLLSRLNMHVRRYERDFGKKLEASRTIGFGHFTLDLDGLLLTMDGKCIELTLREAKLIELLAANPTKIVPTQEILDFAWGQEDQQRTPFALNGVLKRFRQKLHKYGIAAFIENVKGRGFRLVGAVPRTQPQPEESH